MKNSVKKLTIAALGAPIAIGRSAEIFAWKEGLVLKLFFKEIPGADIATEFKNTQEANALGGCPMICHEKVSVEGRTGIVLDRIDGISLTKTPDKNPLLFFSVSKSLAELHAGLHGRKTKKLRDIREIALDMLDTKPLAFLSRDERRKVKGIINALPDGSSLLHMDFHPENVIVRGGEKIIIDWMTAARGNPAADVAYSNFLMRDAELFPGTSRLKLIFYGIVRTYILRGYLKHYMRLTGMTMQEVDRWRLPIIMMRLGFWDIASEKDALVREIKEIIGR
ncbi:MAG: phosphotransferase [Spirochaetes bacterium]|nr:MAG: phosphotransferase [Spirochaetota bacterium]